LTYSASRLAMSALFFAPSGKYFLRRSDESVLDAPRTDMDFRVHSQMSS
jgi:hypothetical protein